ncbi:MAG TPA: FKBP-type peptidyl-prolyl cis-trans isomerase [Bacteroidia bacterium]|nr:FKBP-type peptidyl-prolyl cis-trans isomerase [Bacteroidia bacterium]
MNKLFYFLLLLFFVSCKNEKTQQDTVSNPKIYAEPLINVNKKLIEKESRDIDNWLKRHQVEAKSTGTGLRIAILKKGNGNLAKLGQLATINYKLSLLDGTVCYDSQKSGPETFLIGQDHVESGLHEGIQNMHVGDKALLLMPPHLAHGLLGDDKKIPPLSCIIYEVELLQIKEVQ